ncbi:MULTISPECIES: MARTX multifunctional-autoprocessing repeats-in-toxin holotoxin RtxA [Photorhabdus]|uniref:MARTX multifunctional-autoprocessing repeats-in-toxin holotoxin RtxA n=1 Tax=Photorhabdus TaxID=29487 RepID=UPI000DCC7449|nr:MULTISPECIES: MARTX multifunctional-autoprocessing repeats-in-toxin holotoxin RtxA [Photorhabdus]AXG41947.1 MARTX multifunctional-autoprocessing repeats-in-toxin holotoxin RtxA [Photorhabdus laumondii subsp. laumondii]NDL16709.1 MARTX multifunctional-autoprocessing repeats-in-toxin holotoxin RtxA [Photorhabdus laumondii subsp. laumondii]NDL48358.1 MARTX multifunctional-autoprocessing repeats-in-toxin holotoxin RtxA [Photorhabdus laumondii subsp. laumondii]NDL52908.1 MARTX multifunctional-aut
MGKASNRSAVYLFTGRYYDDNGGNRITAVGAGGEVYAYGGNDDVTVGSFKVDVYHTDGDLTVKGVSGYTGIHKTGNGGLSFTGAAGVAAIDHTGETGNLNYSGAAGYNKLVRKGLSGDTRFRGAGGYNQLWHETNRGNLDFAGAGAGNDINRTWFNRYQDSQGNVIFNGAGAANSINSRVERGNVTFNGAGADNHIVRKGKEGNIILRGAGVSNRIERVYQNKDEYEQTRGDITFEGVGGYNQLYSDVAHGNINFSGAGAYNVITRIDANSDFDGETLEFAKAEEIVLTTATMGGRGIQESQKVTGMKSTVEPNTYLFAFADKMYTKISKVRLQNNPITGKLGYYATSWYKAGNHLENLAAKEISSGNGFIAINVDGAYHLSGLIFERLQPVTIHAIEENLLSDQWVTYAGGVMVKAGDISLGDAKMEGYAVFSDQGKVDVSAVKSNRKPNTYVYAKVIGSYIEVVEVQLANDPETKHLKYIATAWSKAGDHTGDLANEEFSYANGYTSVCPGYTLSQLQYDINTVRRTAHRLVHSKEYHHQDLVKLSASSNDINFNGAGGGNVITSDVTRGDINFTGAGAANVILHGSKFGDTHFNGAGAANVIVKKGKKGDLIFRGAGLANVLVHQGKSGKMDVYAGGAVNVLVRIGDGQYLAHLLAYGNISIHKGNGSSRVRMLGGYNTHTQIGNGDGNWSGKGGFNVITQAGKGSISSVLLGGANALTKLGAGSLVAGMLGGANIISHLSEGTETSNTTAIALGGANILTKKGKGHARAVMGGGANVLTHIGDGNTTGVMLGSANILTKVGSGDSTGIMFGIGNVLTHVGDGLTLGVMAAAGNIFTKVGEGTSIAALTGTGNLFTHVGKGDVWALMGGAVNVFTKVGDGDALALMVAAGNVFTHIGDGTSVALMQAEGNIATKVGNGMTLAAMIGKANLFTHVGEGNTFAALIGGANVLTKVGNDQTAALMIGKANIYSHVGNGPSIGLFAGELNVMTKVGEGTTLAAMFGRANIMTHVGEGLTGVLALGEANIVTKVGNDFMGVVATVKANVITHVGNAATASILFGKGNILTKVGDGTTVGLLISKVGNVMTHVGEGTTVGFAKGKANIITQIGNGTGVNAAWGEANILTQVGNGDHYAFTKGQANFVTKVGMGREVTVVQGDANIITHVGNGDDYTGAWGKANVVTKVGDGRNVVLAKGKANIITQVGQGDSFNALWSEGNIVTKVGDGVQVTAAKGTANVTTTIGNGLNVTAAQGDANINTHVGKGISVNVAWGKYNVNTKVGNGLNVAVMKGQSNANIQVGQGLAVNASYARNNVAIKIGEGDFYSLAVAASNTESNKLAAFFNNIKQTALGVMGSQAINYLVKGEETNTSGTHKGRGAIHLAEVSAIEGFHIDEIAPVSSNLSNRLLGSVTAAETPDLENIHHSLNINESDDSEQEINLIINGDFEQGELGWLATHGIEAYHPASIYVLETEGYGERVSELDVERNTTIYQDLQNLSEGEVISLSFDFANSLHAALTDSGMEVLWNGKLVFSAFDGAAKWQNKTLELTAKTGSNRIEFKGTGEDDGTGYILDNIVAKSKSSRLTKAVIEHAKQGKAAQNALNDKEKAEKDRQLLEQEKEKQLAAMAKSQSRLESTNQAALNQNGQVQRAAIKEEAQAVTEELTLLADKFKALKDKTDGSRELENHYLDYASGIAEDIQKRLDDIKPTLEKRLVDIHRDAIDIQQKVKDTVVLSAAGTEKGKQNRDKAILDGVEAQLKAEQRKKEALLQQQQAEKAKDNANIAYQNAENRGQRDIAAAESKVAQTQADAKGAKLSNAKPVRSGASGSGLSEEKAYESTGAGETGSHIDPESMPEAGNRYYQGLTEDEWQALASAKQAVSRLQINAGIRAKNAGASVISLFSGTSYTRVVEPISNQPRKLIAKAPVMSGINLQGLGQITGGDSLKSHFSILREFEPFLLSQDDKRFIDSTKRYFGQINTDRPSKALEGVREAFNNAVEQPDEQHVLQLEQALAHWQQHDPHEFAKRGRLVKSLRFEMGELVAYLQAKRAESVGVLGISLAPDHVAQFDQQVSFDGFGRVAGLKGDIAQSDINRLTDLQIKPLTQTNSVAEREAPKTESDSLIVFVSRLQQEAIPEGMPLVERAKNLWFSGQVTQQETIKLFEDAATQLQTYPELHTLAQQLLADARKEKATGQYIDNLFGRHFDSELADELVKTAPQDAMTTARQTGQFLVEQFEQWVEGRYPDVTEREKIVAETMESFVKVINRDCRPWFSRVPELMTFLDEPTFANFKTMMTQVDDGFAVIKVPFLAVRMAGTKEMGMDRAAWKVEGDRFYYDVISEARSLGTKLTVGANVTYEVEVTGKMKTNDYGTALPHQPANGKYDDFLYGRNIAVARILTPGRETTFERNGLAHGHAVLTGASGSTNVMVHLNKYIARKQPTFSAEQGYLNTLAFLVFDGGHSVNESLVVYQALQATTDGQRKQILNSYTVNYRDLVDIVGEKGKVWVSQALDNAFKDTEALYRKHVWVKPQHRPAVEALDGLSGKEEALKPAIIDDTHHQGEKISKPLDDWQMVAVTPQIDGRETRFDGQIIIQMEDDPVAAKAAANLAGKHPDSSVVVQLDSEGKYRVVYGDLSQLKPSDKLRWQLVGHGRSKSEQNYTRLGSYSADELAVKLKQFTRNFSQAGKPDHISIVGCSLISDDKRNGFARHFITALKEQGIQTTVSARRSAVAVDVDGRKFTWNERRQWIHKLADNKVVLSWNEKGELETRSERVRHHIAESDIHLSRVGMADAEMPARGAVVDNTDIFIAPEKRKNNIETDSSDISNNWLSYSGNIQVGVGNGEFTALNWGTSNVGVKVGMGGFKSLVFGDNNVMVHIGNGDSKHRVDIAGYQALEGVQMFIGNRNISFNQGRSNDLIVMMDKSLPTPPLVNPFDGTARISGVLQGIAHFGEKQEWLAAQDQQWTLAGAKKFVLDLSGLDQTSSVDYKTLVDLDSQHARSSRGLKQDIEVTLNKKFNQWLTRNVSDMGTMSRANKFRQVNEKLAFNFAVGGRGADIQVTTGNWNLMFGDNIQSILDTNLGSLFGLMTQQYSATGMAKTTFTYHPQDLPRQLKNKLLGRLAGVNAETTLADIFGVNYTPEGQMVSRTGDLVNGEAILREMLAVIAEFSGDQLKAFTNPEKLLDGLKAGMAMGGDGIRSFAESHGLQERAPDENRGSELPVSINGISAQADDKAKPVFGFNSLNLPNLFATMFSQDKQTEMHSLVTHLKENLTADLLNMEQKTFDFLRNSGHLQGDGDIHISLGNYNFNWGGDGKDLGAYLGDNNNFWGGRGEDVYYAIGTSNLFTGGEGNDLGVLMGRENGMFGGHGDDTAVIAGRINYAFMGEGNDQTFVFGEGGLIDAGNGDDYVVTSGNYNRVETGEGQDYAVTIGNNNRVELGEGHDFGRVFGNDNQIDGNAGDDVIKLMGYHAVINGGEGDDHLIAATMSKFSQFDGGEGQDLLVLGGYQNDFRGGAGVDSFVVSGQVIDSQVDDINAEDMIVFNDIDWQNLWFQRSGYDLVLSVNRHIEDKTAQGVFESTGSVTFSDYFNGNRAKLVVQMGDKNASGEREFTALSDNAVDTLIQAMSSFAPTVGDNGFIDNLASQEKIVMATAWADTTVGKVQFA